MSNDSGAIGLEMAESCGSPTSAEITEPAGKSSRSVKKPMFGHQFGGKLVRKGMIWAKNELISHLILMAITLAVFTGLTAASVAAKELKLAEFVSEKHPMDRFIIRPWANLVSKQSGGSLVIKIYAGGALGKGPVKQFRRAVDGIADIAFGLPSYTSNLFPRTAIIELPGVAPTAVAAVDKFWDAFPLFEPEYENVKLLGLWFSERMILMTSSKPVRAVADMRGLKFRVPSKVHGRSIKALGSIPVFMPITRVHEALKTGAIDGVLSTPSSIRSFKLSEVTKHMLTTLPVGRLSFFLVMNKKAWNGLSVENKALVENSTGREFSKKASRFYMKAGKGGLSVATRSTTMNVIKLHPKEHEKFVAILEKVPTDWVIELEKQGIPARRVAKAIGVGS
jgi:TRAP-type C4-dicarboxylate transport system substrate-binding protein